MNKEHMYAVADAIENNLDGIIFDMYYPLVWRSEGKRCGCVAGIAKHLSDYKDMTTFDAGALYMGLDRNGILEIYHAVSMGAGGSGAINNAKPLVPAALRWMADNDDVNWRRALTAVMMNAATGKDK